METCCEIVLVKIYVPLQNTPRDFGPVGEDGTRSRKDREIPAVSLETHGNGTGHIITERWIVNAGRIPDVEKLDLDRSGVIIGSGIGGLAEIEKEFRKLLERGPSRVSPFTVPKMMVNACSANVSIHFGFRGSNTTVVTACASAANAIGDAMYEIRCGNADVMITGGAEAAIVPLGLASFCSLKALSTRNDDPEHASRPFDRDRDGFVLGEGAGILILEEFEAAKKRGARIYVELVGFGMSADGGHITAPDPKGAGAAKAMAAALQDAAVAPEDIDYINAHGTGTRMNDACETLAMKTVFNSHARKLAISSTKSHLGHLLGASGGVELVVTALAICNSTIPQTINLENPDEACDLDYTPLEPREASIRYALSNSFGFGGHNAALVIGRI
ncbi:MAG: beta-ketoacyl-ACP synthase II [Planctomycetes bacterium]|nr:beta-ketoacyl-ACP synthase II [Planctomycetota bacterium]